VRSGNGAARTYAPPFVAQQSAFEYRLRHFLDEKRNAVGTVQDLFEEDRRQCPAARDACYERGVVASSEPGQRQRRDMGLAEARRLELRSICEDEQRRQATNAFNEDVEELARRRIDPMRILEQDQYRLPCRERGESHRQEVEKQLLAPLGT